MPPLDLIGRMPGTFTPVRAYSDGPCQIPAGTGKLGIMPELPDIAAYIAALEARIVGQPIEHIRIASPFLLRTAQTPLADIEGRAVCALHRIGKRIVIGIDGDYWLALHLMRGCSGRTGREPWKNWKLESDGNANHGAGRT